MIKPSHRLVTSSPCASSRVRPTHKRRHRPHRRTLRRRKSSSAVAPEPEAAPAVESPPAAPETAPAVESPPSAPAPAPAPVFAPTPAPPGVARAARLLQRSSRSDARLPFVDDPRIYERGMIDGPRKGFVFQCRVRARAHWSGSFDGTDIDARFVNPLEVTLALGGRIAIAPAEHHHRGGRRLARQPGLRERLRTRRRSGSISTSTPPTATRSAPSTRKVLGCRP